MALSKNKKGYLIILEINVKEEIDKIASIEDRSASNLINKILKQYIENREEKK